MLHPRLLVFWHLGAGGFHRRDEALQQSFIQLAVVRVRQPQADLLGALGHRLGRHAGPDVLPILGDAALPVEQTALDPLHLHAAPRALVQHLG